MSWMKTLAESYPAACEAAGGETDLPRYLKRLPVGVTT
jgi:hypothetical protein